MEQESSSPGPHLSQAAASNTSISDISPTFSVILDTSLHPHLFLLSVETTSFATFWLAHPSYPTRPFSRYFLLQQVPYTTSLTYFSSIQVPQQPFQVRQRFTCTLQTLSTAFGAHLQNLLSLKCSYTRSTIWSNFNWVSLFQFLRWPLQFLKNSGQKSQYISK